MTSDLEQFQFAEAARRLRDFTWGDFCDWYLEFVKGRLRDPDDPSDRPARAGGAARRALPAAPSDHAVRDRTGLAGLERPGARARACPSREPPRRASASRPGRARWAGPDETARQTVDHWCEAIKAIRNLKAERNVPKEARIAPIIVAQGTVADMAAPGRAVPAEPVAGRVGDDRRRRSSARPSAPWRSCPRPRSSCRWRA